MKYAPTREKLNMLNSIKYLLQQILDKLRRE